VADFRPARPAAGKIKKESGIPAIELERTEDVLATLAARRRPGQVLVGFAAERGEEAVRYGREKLARKGLDAIVVNDIGIAGIGFDATENEVTIVAADGAERHVPRVSKAAVAAAVLDEAERLRTGGEETDGARRAGIRSVAGI
jgi:phosphopantothenoylcysteine decarboxylase/phosphopantothenate--cysteine ligase